MCYLKKIMNENHKDGRRKILFLITKSNWGGAQRYVYDLATNLSNDKFDVSVVAGGSGPLIEKLIEAKIRTIVFSQLSRDVKIFDDIKTFFMLISLFRKERPDIIHLNSNKIGGLGSLAGRLTGASKIIYTIHGFAFNEVRTLISRGIIWFLTYLNIIMAHHVIAVSKSIFDEAIRFPLSKGKINLIHNGIEKIEFFDKDSARTSLLKRKTAGNPSIGTISELHSNKGLDSAILAFNEVKVSSPKARFIIIGEGEERENLTNLIKKLELEDSVFLLGHIDRASRYLKMFDLFVLSSITEALGYVLLEAGMAGIPVVATNVGGIPDIVENMKTGILVKSRNYKELAAGIKYSISNKELTGELAKNLTEKVMNDFSIEKMIERTSSLYI